MSDLKWYSIQMADGISCEKPAFNLVELVKTVNKFMRNHTYHEDEILTIDYLGDEWQATPMKSVQEETIHKKEFPFDEIRDQHGDYFSTVADAKKHSGYDESHIWSVTECEGAWSYGPSHHYINLIGYIATHESHDGNTYYEEEDWREQEELAEAEETINNALSAVFDYAIDKDSDEAKKIDEAWELITKKLRGDNDE